MRIRSIEAIAVADASVDESGVAIPFAWANYLSAQVIVAGSSTGTLKLQYSNDPVFSPTAPTNWSDFPSGGSVTVTTAGVSGIPAMQACYNYIRANWAKNNGSAGTVTVNLQVQGAS